MYSEPPSAFGISPRASGGRWDQGGVLAAHATQTRVQHTIT